MIKVFEMVREEDPSGVSGTGRVAEGVVFSDGTTVLRWTAGDVHSTVVYASLEDAVRIHGHGGLTRFEFRQVNGRRRGA